jgi:hypothetical protein
MALKGQLTGDERAAVQALRDVADGRISYREGKRRFEGNPRKLLTLSGAMRILGEAALLIVAWQNAHWSVATILTLVTIQIELMVRFGERP